MAANRAPTNGKENPRAVLPLDKILTPLKIPKSEIVDVFVLGSRLWGTANANSDYDTYIVVRDGCSVASGLPRLKGFASVHSGNIDALIILESVYHGTNGRLYA